MIYGKFLETSPLPMRQGSNHTLSHPLYLLLFRRYTLWNVDLKLSHPSTQSLLSSPISGIWKYGEPSLTLPCKWTRRCKSAWDRAPTVNTVVEVILQTTT